MNKPIDVDLQALETFFRQDPNVVLAVLFGSSANGTVKMGSDLDVAILFHQPPPPGSVYLDYYLKLCDAIPAIEVVDLVNLNTANPILAFEALSGRIVCKNDPEAAAAFTSLVCREYEDAMGNLAHQMKLRTQAA
jgi:predicted nucleotidyltransferase